MSLEKIKNYFEPKSILDIGANIGTFTTWLSKAFPNGKIYSFEPQRAVFQMLSGNVAINNLYNVYTHNIALGEENYKKWQKRNQSLTYSFEQDIIHLFNSTQSPNDMLIVENGEYPLLLKEMFHGNISIETICILNDIMNFLPMWSKKITDDIIWPTHKRKMEKYTPFIIYDKNKFINILKESLKEYA